MNFSNAAFEFAAGTVNQLPASDMPEVCFIGRSNVGKSSLINKITGRKNLAYTGQKPGKTVTVNFYRLDGMRLVDMPGYGYAKVSEDEKLRWAALCEGYFAAKRCVKAAFLLVDMRRTPTEDDIQMADFLSKCGLKFYVVLTKSDKLNKGDRAKMADLYAKTFPDNGIIPFSSLNGEGVERLREIVESAKGEEEC